jgi:hypothetical protein
MLGTTPQDAQLAVAALQVTQGSTSVPLVTAATGRSSNDAGGPAPRRSPDDDVDPERSQRSGARRQVCRCGTPRLLCFGSTADGIAMLLRTGGSGPRTELGAVAQDLRDALG